MRVRKKRTYFDQAVEDAIVEYNQTDNWVRRERLFNTLIYPALDKLVENVIHSFKFYYYENTYEDLKHETVVYLHERLGRYTQEKGKAFSYFTIVARNYLIQQNTVNYEHLKARGDLMLVDEVRDVVGEVLQQERKEAVEDFIALWAVWCDDHLEELFESKRDQKIANAIFTLFKTCRDIDNFNKKALYIMIREQTDVKTSYITSVLSEVKALYLRMYQDYLYGDVSDWEKYLLKRR
jgi:hypothetical protein